MSDNPAFLHADRALLAMREVVRDSFRNGWRMCQEEHGKDVLSMEAYANGLEAAGLVEVIEEQFWKEYNAQPIKPKASVAEETGT